jgi:murein DD-endopeptidase MepM/ murein hydrolase activator NlpD
LPSNRYVASILSLVLCAAILVAGPVREAFAATVINGQPATLQSTVSNYQSQIAQINSRMKQIEEENKQLQNEIQKAKTEKEQAKAKRNVIDQQIKLTKDEISLLQERIQLLEQDIAEKKREISEKQAEIDRNYALYLQRMRAMYMQDDTTTLGLLLGADSFTTFLTNTDSMARVAEHDRKLVANLTSQREELEQAKAELAQRLEQLESDKAQNEEKQQTLSGQLQAADLQIHSLDQMEKEYYADLEKNKAMLAAMRQEINDLYAKIEWSKNPYVGGEMAWPVPGFYRISSEYGYRFGGSDFHTGMDIAGTNGSIYGATVVAANTGTVKYVNWSYTPGRGYGIYLILDHGGGISTLYAHLSNITVSLGDVVGKGDPIGNVGSTGWSTGPHLHFEVRVNGSHTNPKPYVIGR